jgi:hypothetical protein
VDQIAAALHASLRIGEDARAAIQSAEGTTKATKVIKAAKSRSDDDHQTMQ